MPAVQGRAAHLSHRVMQPEVVASPVRISCGHQARFMKLVVDQALLCGSVKGSSIQSCSPRCSVRWLYIVT